MYLAIAKLTFKIFHHVIYYLGAWAFRVQMGDAKTKINEFPISHDLMEKKCATEKSLLFLCYME